MISPHNALTSLNTAVRLGLGGTLIKKASRAVARVATPRRGGVGGEVRTSDTRRQDRANTSVVDLTKLCFKFLDTFP